MTFLISQARISGISELVFLAMLSAEQPRAEHADWTEAFDVVMVEIRLWIKKSIAGMHVTCN